MALTYVSEYVSHTLTSPGYPPGKQDNVDRYGSPYNTLDRSPHSPLKPITLAELDRPSTPLLSNKEPTSPGSPYEDAPPRPPLPNMLNHGEILETPLTCILKLS